MSVKCQGISLGGLVGTLWNLQKVDCDILVIILLHVNRSVTGRAVIVNTWVTAWCSG